MEGISEAALISNMQELIKKSSNMDNTASLNSSVLKFEDALKDMVNKVNNDELNSTQLAEAFIAKDPNVSLGEAMIAMQKSNISFQALSEVRNKLVDAYREIANMSV